MTDSNARHEPDEHKVGATRPDETDYQGISVLCIFWLCTFVHVGSSRIDSYVSQSHGCQELLRQPPFEEHDAPEENTA